MKKIIIIVVMFLLSSSIFSQNYFKNYDFGFVFNNQVRLAFCRGDMVIAAAAKYDSSLSIVKIDQQGNIMSNKNYKFDDVPNIWSQITLADSSVAMMLCPSSSNSMYFVKVDLNCNILWAKQIVDTNGVIKTNFRDIAPYGDGGLVVISSSCPYTTEIIFLDDNGNIVRQNSYNGGPMLSNTNIINDGFDNYSVCSFSGNGPVFYQFDNAGNISSFTEINNLNGMAGAPPLNRHLSKSKNGGHYMSTNLYDSLYNSKTLLFYFDSFSQLVWTKIIELPIYQFWTKDVLPTNDNGCIVINQNCANPGFSCLPFFMKFDSTGNVEWMRLVGDTTVIDWDYLVANDELIVNDQIICSTYGLGGNHFIFNTDTAFNGVCYTSQPQPPIFNNDYPSTASYLCSNSHMNYQTSNINVQLQSDNSTSQNWCQGNGVFENVHERSVSVFPNPIFNNKLNISGNIQHTNLQVYNAKGILIQDSFIESEQELIDMTNYPSGIYLIKISSIDWQKTIPVSKID